MPLKICGFFVIPVLGCLLGLATAPLNAQDIVAEPNLRLFTVLAAINVAGYDAGTDRPELAPVRAAVRRELATREIASLPALREFYRNHRLADPSHDLSQYVSLALFLSGPPNFELQLNPASLPPDVLELEEMVPLIDAFYREADIPTLWEKYLPAMEEESERYRKFLARVIQETNGYLRLDTSGYWNRRFAIYISPLGLPNQTDARSYGEHYSIVAGPTEDLPEEEIRHGWLHYLLDPYPLKYPRIVQSKAELLPITRRAPGLEEAFRNSFSLLLTESLIRAIQARRSTTSPEARMRAAEEAVEEGFFLTAYFSEALERFEQQPVGMRLYYPEMMEAISVQNETERAAKIEFRRPPTDSRHESLWSSMELIASQAEQRIARGEYEQARQILEALSQQYGPSARTLYGLALVATQQKQPEQAKRYFTQAASLSGDPRIKAWSHIYLGRLLDLEGNREAARAEYAAALEAGDSSADTRAAAENGLQAGFSPVPRTGSTPPESEKEQEPRKRIPLAKQDD